MRYRLNLILIALLMVGVISWAGYGQKSNVKKTSWEYMMVEYGNYDEASRRLNELGAEGWELVAMTDRSVHNSSSNQFVLKRVR